METTEFRSLLLRAIDNKENPYHPLVWINGDPQIGVGTSVGGFSEINAKGARVIIGRGCDIASFVVINAADSHLRCIGLADEITRRDIIIGDHVFIGTQCTVLGGATIGHHCVIAAGTVVRAGSIPPFSLVIGNEVKAGFYRAQYQARHGSCPD